MNHRNQTRPEPAELSNGMGARSPGTPGDERTGSTPTRAEEVDDRLASERHDVGGSASSSKHPPHVAQHEIDAPIQDESVSPTAVPTLPANASGEDAATPEEQDEEVDPESMYDGRPERFEDFPPSERDERTERRER